MTSLHKKIYTYYPEVTFIWKANPGACEECQARDGKKYTYEEIARLGRPHPNCKCTLEVDPDFLESIGENGYFGIFDGLARYTDDSIPDSVTEEDDEKKGISRRQPVFIDAKEYFPEFEQFNPDLFPDLRNKLKNAYNECVPVAISEKGTYDDSCLLSAFGNVTVLLNGDFNPKTNRLVADLEIAPDVFDFDASNHRSDLKEILTTVGRVFIPGKSYKIYFVGTFHYDITRAWGPGYRCRGK